MKTKIILLIFVVAIFGLMLTTNAMAESLTICGLDVKLTDAKGSSSNGGTLSYGSFPQTFYVSALSSDSNAKISIEIIDPKGKVIKTNKFTVKSNSDTGTYKVRATTDGGAVKEIAIHIKYEVKADANSDYKYRTVALQISSVSLNKKTIMSGLNTRVELVGGTALAPSADSILTNLLKKTDGETYTLYGSLVVEVYTSQKVVGTYVVSKDWNKLVSDYDWIPQTLEAFATMQVASTVYQAPTKVQTRVEWRDVTNGTVLLDSVINNDIIKPNQWVKMSSYITDRDIDDKYNHISTGYIIKYPDGSTEEVIGEPTDSMVVYCYSHMSSITVVYDYVVPVQRDMSLIGPGAPSYPENEDVVTWVTLNLQGEQILPSDKVKAVIEIPELGYVYETEVICKENGSVKIPFKWHTPNVTTEKNITIKATVNSNRAVTESNYSNNSISFVAMIKNMTYTTPTERSESYPSVPNRSTVTTLMWTEPRYQGGKIVNKMFYVKLNVDVEINYTTKQKGYIRSGYGFTLNVKYEIDTNYDKPWLITDCQMAKVALPQYTYWNYVYLERENSSTWQFTPHLDSPDGYRKQYVPIWWDDDKPYEIQVMCGEIYTPAGLLEVWVTSKQNGELKLNIEGSMYDDDHIGY